MSANEQESIIAEAKVRLKERRLKKKKKDLLCQEWDSNPRLHSGPEHSLPFKR